MRTIFLSLALLFVSVTVSANVSGPEILNLKARQVVKEALVYPDFAIEQGIEGVVYMRLQVNEQGKIEVIKANSTSNELLRYAVDKIEGMQVEKGQYEVGAPFNMKFKFMLY